MNYSIHFTHHTSLTDIDVNPDSQIGNTSYFENSDGLLAIQHDLHEIHELGFNTIRLTTGIRRYNAPPVNVNGYTSPCYPQITSPLFTFDWFMHSWSSDANENNCCNQCFAITAPYDVANNSNMNLFLQKINSVITIAEAESLKVILMTADGFQLFNGDGGAINTNQAAVDDFQHFLEAMTSYFAGNTTIMAYDFKNEPHYQDINQNVLRSKKEVCEAMAQLYDAIKQPTVDPNHLITIGLGDEGTLFSWDPEVMKTDFVCFHFYPNPEWKYDFVVNNQQTVMQHAKDRLLDEIYWASQYVNRPWVLEETGFNSTTLSDWTCYGVNGNYNDLADYLTSFLPEIKNCGVSGFAWWNFQDEYTVTPPLVCDPAEQAAKDYRYRYWGIISTGDPDANGSYAALEKEPAADVFRAFNWYAAASPCNSTPASATYLATEHYYNPYLHQTNNNTVAGTVVDQDNNPIAGALVSGTDWISTDKTDPNSWIYVHSGSYTFTDINGDFEIIPFNYENQADPRLVHIYVGALGCKRFDDGPWGETQMNTSQGNIPLQKVSLNYDEHISNITVDVGDAKLYKGWNTLTVNDVNVNGNNTTGGIADFTARSDVTINYEFDASAGSEVHIYNSPTFADCFDYNGYLRMPNHDLSNTNESGNAKEIELNFSFVHDVFDLRIYPNPNSGTFNINIQNPMNDEVTLTAENLMGEIVWTVQTLKSNIVADFSFLPKGMYLVHVKSKNSSITKKLLIN